MVSSFDRQLRRNGNGQTVSQYAFKKVIETLAMKQCQLNRSGKGNLPNDDINQLWTSKQLGVSTPDTDLRIYGCITPYILVCEAVKSIVICVGVTFPCSLTNMAVNICSSPTNQDAFW
ncbi:hypothetical protein DPMN_049323 [Dreissena polymorpha]|uniref:Uncharacterized protein n=1 Tax=Dreissena polymorpha TaxID=45954 RepID=A0A9D4CFD5_DREPO|nr:hypothetical protein DPMN_049323 [Dreissena polymorpha]